MKHSLVRFQASAMVWVRPSLFWDVMQHMLVVCLTLEGWTDKLPEMSVNRYKHMWQKISEEQKLETFPYILGSTNCL